MNGFETLVLEKRDDIAWLTLNRPRVHNAVNLAMRDELWSAIEALILDPDVGVVVFRGAGEKAFSAGADLNDFGSSASFTEARRGRRERDLWGRLARFEKPMIAAVQGYAYGAGCELSLFCDLRVASEDAKFALPEVKLGYLPSAGGTQMLPRLIGAGRAFAMISSGEPVSAREALEWGLVYRVAPRAELYEVAELLARRLLAQPAAALRAAKAAVLEGLDLSLSAGLSLEASKRIGLLRLSR